MSFKIFVLNTLYVHKSRKQHNRLYITTVTYDSYQDFATLASFTIIFFFLSLLVFLPEYFKATPRYHTISLHPPSEYDGCNKYILKT